MIDVPARHEHALRTHLDLLAAHSTGRRLKRRLRRTELAWLQLVRLAVLLLDFDDREPIDSLDARLVLPPLQFCLAFRDPAHHLKDVITR